MTGLNALAPLLLAMVTVSQTPAPAPSVNPAGAPADPLFASQDMITLEIVGPMDAISDDRAAEPEEPEYRETVVRWSVGSDQGELPARIRGRGNFRLKRSTCRDMPPLRLNFVKEDVVGTLFDGQDRIKLVTHCRDDDDYEQNVLEEYLAYRLYNQISDQSFRVRLALITYVDTEENESRTRHGFLIEDEDRMAARLGGAIEEFEQIHPHRYVEGTEPRVSVFSFMIGNTDFSSVAGHNVVVVRLEDGGLIPIPYDFDWSGLVGARYARPAEQLHIRHVRQRLYRGFCRPGQSFEPVFESFRELKPALPSLYEELDGWKEDDGKKAREYLDEFFEVLEDEGKARREIVEACRNTVS